MVYYCIFWSRKNVYIFLDMNEISVDSDDSLQDADYIPNQDNIRSSSG